jgi:thioredoxin reductase
VASRAVLLATGTRETPRGARLTGGARPWGVTTTGAFQEMAYAGQAVPFRRPVIVGSELVAFSALLTARHAGVRPVAILEEAARIVAPRPAGLAARLWFGVPVLTGARLVAVLGGARVEGVAIEQSGLRREIACDGVIFSGKFIPESFLARTSGVAIDAGTGGPVIDTAYRCSMDRVFAAGNVLRPVEHSGVAALEGVAAARAILRALRHTLPPRALGVPVRAGGALRYVYPQLLLPEPGRVRLLGRARVAHRGWLRLVVDGRTLARRPADVLPERRIGLWVSPDALRAARAVELVLD